MINNIHMFLKRIATFFLGLVVILTMLPFATGKVEAASYYVNGKTYCGGIQTSAYVTLSGAASRSQTSAGDGSYAFFVPAGNYTVRASKSGCYDAAVGLYLGSNKLINIYMTKIPPPTKAPTRVPPTPTKRPPTPTPIPYSILHTCVKSETVPPGGNAVGIPYATVQLSGYSTTGVDSTGCHDYTVRKFQTATVTAKASGFNSKPQSLYIDNNQEFMTIRLTRSPTSAPTAKPTAKPTVKPTITKTPTPRPPTPTPLTYAILHTCVKSNPLPGASIPYASVQLSGFSATNVDSVGCHDYNVLKNQTAKVTARASGFTSKSESLFIDNNQEFMTIYMDRTPTSAPTVKPTITKTPTPAPSNYAKLKVTINQSDGDSPGKPLPFASVALARPDGTYYADIQTDGNGAYTYSVPKNQIAFVKAKKSGFSEKVGSVKVGTVNTSMSITLFASPTTAPTGAPTAKPTSSPTLVSLTVKTLAATGITAPVANANVTTCPTNTTPSNCTIGTTNGSGTVTLRVRGNSAYRITAEQKDLAIRGTTQINVTTAAQNVTLYLDKSHSGIIKGTIYLQTASGSTTTYTGANVQVALSGNGTGTTTTNSIGSYSFTDLAVPSTYTVKITAPTGYKVVSTNPVTDIHPPTNLNSFEIVNFTIQKIVVPTVNPCTANSTVCITPSIPKTQGVIYGSVRDQNGRAIPNVTVQVRKANTVNLVTQTATNNNGYYITQYLPYDTYNVSFTVACHYSTSYQNLTLRTSVTTLNRTMQRFVSSTCPEPTGPAPTIAPLPTDYPGGGTTPPPDNNPTYPPSPSNNPYPTEKPQPSIKPTAKPTATNAIYTIKGQIWIKNGSKKQKYTGGGMNVTATNQSNQHKTVKIANDGTYEIPGLSQKNYTVSTTAPKDTALMTANDVSVTFTTTQTATVDFTLASTITPTITTAPTMTPSPSPTITPSPQVTNTTVSVNPTTNTTSCPAVFTFTATVSISAPGTVTYTWLRSDNATAPVQSLTFTAAGSKSVTDTWTLGSNTDADFDPFNGWEAIKILSPNSLVSNQASFSLYCITPTNTVTPEPTGTLEPTATNGPSPTTVLTQTPAPTSTPAPNHTFITLHVELHDIGISGDSQNPYPIPCQKATFSAIDCLSNQNPVHSQRPVDVTVFTNGTNKIIKTGTLTYDPADGLFTGTIDLGTDVATDDYSVYIHTGQFLSKIVSGQHITADETTPIAKSTLVTGDANGDNAQSILDYSLLMGCYTTPNTPAKACDAEKQINTDLNDDGIVDQLDYNLFLRDLVTHNGDQLPF